MGGESRTMSSAMCGAARYGLVHSITFLDFLRVHGLWTLLFAFDSFDVDAILGPIIYHLHVGTPALVV